MQTVLSGAIYKQYAKNDTSASSFTLSRTRATWIIYTIVVSESAMSLLLLVGRGLEY